MKRMMSLSLALLLAFSLTACTNGGSAASADAPAAAPSQAESTAAEKETTAETASVPAASESAAAEAETAEASAGGESDLAAVQEKGTLVVGITNFEPMDYQDENGEWIGFDADLARQFAEYIGVEVEFSEITWDYKVMELEAGNVDCLWNGMTLTDEVTSSMATSIPYCTNYQVLVYPAASAADFEGLTSLEGLNVAVESGSAGEDAAEALGASTVPVQSQANTLMEVSAGTSDAAVIDVLMAAAMTGEGTSYADLSYSVNLNEVQGLESEQYGVGFRKGSDLTEAFNTFWEEKVADGTVEEIADTYGLQDAVILE
ncbi:MAG TPA: transporter substrate-binding domain-containing protein [Candidatus Eisenbergiella intestinipullorum]|nr:transporter substrate-binding domain-containing protein [Candidatus Eisenbergiella intestinipullorum]